MEKLQIFSNEQFGSIRTLEIGNVVWFVGKDVAEALGYSNPRKAMIDHIDEEDKGVTKCDTLGGSQNLTIINESGLYSLILSSKLTKAKEFKHWVTSEVLPTIRKHGMYATDELLNNPDFAIKVFTELREERLKRQALETENKKLKPSAEFADRVLDSKGLVTITQIAKDYGMSGKSMNELLHSFGVQYKQSRQWLLYSKHQNKGYTHSKTVEIIRSDNTAETVMETKWTQKGRKFIYDVLKRHGILPIIEQ